MASEIGIGRSEPSHETILLVGTRTFVLQAERTNWPEHLTSGRVSPMKILAVHPSSLMYSKIFLRLEPLGIELIAAAARRAGHDVRLLDLQVEPTGELSAGSSGEWRPDAVAISCNYLANVPEVIELAKAAAASCPRPLSSPAATVHRSSPRTARPRRRRDRLRAQG